ncbi:MAG: hypothetical protein IKG14_05830 [Clostridia bacterium]|nr:hypothetical protein [Clostridia bacterium]
MEKNIYPYLIEEQKIKKYYELLLNNNYKLKIFDKKKNKEIYNLFLPKIRNLLFWTFNLNSTNKKNSKEEFNNTQNELKSTICGNYYCNVFEKKDTTIICFNNGICFGIGNNEKEIKKAKRYQKNLNMAEINIREEEKYTIIEKKTENEAITYLYILELYKMIFLNKTQKDIADPNKFNKARIKFVKFSEQIYNIKITDNTEANEKINEWDKEFELDNIYIKIDNSFDLLYKNNRINENIKLKIICIIMCAITTIVGIINLCITIS